MLNCNIKKTLRNFDLNMNFSIDRETLVIVGHSGCGKSTTLKILSGLLAPDEGRITVGERTFFDQKQKVNVPPEARSLGFVFQSYALFPHLSVFENIAYGLDSKKMSKAERAEKVEKMVESLNISHLITSMPADLSGGEQQRVALARSLVLEPEVLLLDEPLSALDVTTRGRVRRELKKTLATLDIPTIIVTHDYEDAISLGDRILVMDQGHVIQEGGPEELLAFPRSPFVADFSGTNFFFGEAARTESGINRVRLRQQEETLLLAEPVAEGPLSIMIYPWDIELAKERSGNCEKINVLQGKAVNILSYGNRARVEIEGDLPLTVEVSTETLKQLGLKEQETVFARIAPDKIQGLKNTQEVI